MVTYCIIVSNQWMKFGSMPCDCQVAARRSYIAGFYFLPFKLKNITIPVFVLICNLAIQFLMSNKQSPKKLIFEDQQDLQDKKGREIKRSRLTWLFRCFLFLGLFLIYPVISWNILLFSIRGNLSFSKFIFEPGLPKIHQ